MPLGEMLLKCDIIYFSEVILSPFPQAGFIKHVSQAKFLCNEDLIVVAFGHPTTFGSGHTCVFPLFLPFFLTFWNALKISIIASWSCVLVIIHTM